LSDAAEKLDAAVAGKPDEAAATGSSASLPQPVESQGAWACYENVDVIDYAGDIDVDAMDCSSPWQLAAVKLRVEQTGCSGFAVVKGIACLKRTKEELTPACLRPAEHRNTFWLYSPSQRQDVAEEPTAAASLERKATAGSVDLKRTMSTLANMSAENLKNVTEAANELEIASRKVTYTAAAAPPSATPSAAPEEPLLAGGGSRSRAGSLAPGGGADQVAIRQFSRAASQLEEMLLPEPSSSSSGRRTLIRKSTTKDLSLQAGDGKDLINKVQVVAEAFQTLAKSATQEEMLEAPAAPPVASSTRPTLQKSISRSSTTSLGKTCKKCKNCYSGFGDTCSKCRKFGKAGTMLQCVRCQNYFAGYQGTCNDCSVPQDRAAALAAAAEALAAAAVAVAQASHMFAPQPAIREEEQEVEAM